MSRIHRIKSEYKIKKSKTAIKKEKRNNKLMKFVNWFILVFAAIVLGYGLIAFCVSSVRVCDSSMETNLQNGDTVILNKVAYTFVDIRRFDVVAFKKLGQIGYYNIKRVIGLPGETVQIKNGKVYIDGEELDYELDYIMNEGMAGSAIKLDREEYFVLGDNVNNSEDSRYSNVGIIMESEIKGKISNPVKHKE